MSDIPPKGVILPDLPNEIMLGIFHRCDARTLLSVRSTCRYWRTKLNSYEFITEMGTRWKSNGCSLFAHFGFSSRWATPLDWMMKINAWSGQTSAFQFPFLLTQEGWFHIIGVQNGIFCIRYCSMGKRTFILIWNPTTRKSSIMNDPGKHYCDDCAFFFSFVYYPRSVNYAIVHLFKEKPESPGWTLTMSTNLVRGWNVSLTCPPYVDRLDPDYVSLDGVIYWVSCLLHEEDVDPPCIVSFSVVTFTFHKFSLPTEAHAHCHNLLIRNDKLCLATNNHDDQSYTSTIWQADAINDDIIWSKLYTFNGIGVPYIPALFVDDNLLHIMERHLPMLDMDGMKSTYFHILKYNETNHTRKTVRWIQYDSYVKMKSIHKFNESFFPV